MGGKKKGGGGGGKNSIMNGRALFTFNPDLFKDNDMEVAKPTTAKDEEEKQAEDDGQIEEKAEVDESLFQGDNADEDEDVDFD